MAKVLLFLCFMLVAAEAAYDNLFRQATVSQWHHGDFHDVSSSIAFDAHQLLHSRAEVPFEVPLEVNVVLVGFNGDGGYRYSLDVEKMRHILEKGMAAHRPACLETGQRLDIEHKLLYNIIPVGQIELMTLERALKAAMVEAGSARETEFGRETPLYEVEATSVEPIFDKLYDFLFNFEPKSSAIEMNSPVPTAIFVLNFDKVRMDPRTPLANEDTITAKIEELSAEQLKEQEGGYIYKYRYNGGASSQVWLSSGRYAVIDISAGPSTYGKVESEEGSVGYRSLPRLQSLFFSRGRIPLKNKRTDDDFAGQLAALIASAIEHLFSSDVRYETIDVAKRLLVSIVVLRNHHQFSLFHSGNNFSIDMHAIEEQVKKLVQPDQEVVVVGGTHNLHDHERLAIAVKKALRGKSTQQTLNDGRYHVQTKSYLDAAILREEMKHSADMLASGLLELADPTLSPRFFHYMDWAGDNNDSLHDAFIKSSAPGFGPYGKEERKKRRLEKKQEKASPVERSYGTRVIPVYILSLAGIEKDLLIDGESLLWTSSDAVFVLQHYNPPIPLSYVSETKRREALPLSPQRHIIAGLASVIGGLVAPYERASPVHQRPLVNWLWACGHHPFGPFSNTSGISQLLLDTALRNSIYAQVDKALHIVRESTQAIQSFTNLYLRTPLGETVKGQKPKSVPELWLDKFYKKTTNLPQPIPHELVQQLESYLDELEKKLVDLSSLLYDHRLKDAYFNSTNLFQYATFTKAYVDHVLSNERDRMKCCSVKYTKPAQASQTFVYGGILIAGFVVYFLIIFFSSPEK